MVPMVCSPVNCAAQESEKLTLISWLYFPSILYRNISNDDKISYLEALNIVRELFVDALVRLECLRVVATLPVTASHHQLPLDLSRSAMSHHVTCHVSSHRSYLILLRKFITMYGVTLEGNTVFPQEQTCV